MKRRISDYIVEISAYIDQLESEIDSLTEANSVLESKQYDLEQEIVELNVRLDSI